MSLCGAVSYCYAECRYAECHYAECRGGPTEVAQNAFKIKI